MTKTSKGKFILGTRTYHWQAIVDGVIGFGMTKQEAIKSAQTELRARRSDLEAYLNFMDQVI